MIRFAVAISAIALLGVLVTRSLTLQRTGPYELPSRSVLRDHTAYTDTGPSYLVNGDFEADNIGDWHLPDGTNELAVAQHLAGVNGTRAVQLHGSGPCFCQVIAWRQDAQYVTARAWVKVCEDTATATSTAELTVSCHDERAAEPNRCCPSWGILASATTTLAIDDTRWHMMELTIEVARHTCQLRISLCNKSANDARMYFDNVTLVPSRPTLPLSRHGPE